MTRPYLFRIEHWLQVGTLLALTAALSGCGATGTGSPPATTAPTQSSGPAAGGTVEHPAVGGGGGGGGAASGSTDNAVFVPVSQGSLGKVAHTSTQLNTTTGQLTHASLQVTHSALSQPVPSSSVHQPSGGGSNTGTAQHNAAGGAHHNTSDAGSSVPAGGPSAGGRAESKPHVRYVIRYDTILRTVSPDVPAGAVMPSSRIVSLPRFAVGDNLVCMVSGTSARCDIDHHTWVPATPEPRACHRTWGRALEVVGASTARFLCTNTTLFSGHPPQINPGYDDVLGAVRCEVRSFGVNCFVFQHHGFSISRGGYLRY